MKQTVVSFVSGLIFAFGLGISGMTQPQKIIAFLNLGGEWSPALICVMAAAVLVFGIAYHFTRKRPYPIMAREWHLPEKAPITMALLIGSVLFGIGWGLSGYCPGPAFVSLVSLQVPTLIFVVSMLAGMFGFKMFDRRKQS